MIEFSVETDIARPVPEVFAYVTDPEKLPSWQTNTVSAEQEGDGPLGLGTRIREVHRGPGGKEMASLVEVSEFERDRAFALKIVEGPMPIDAHISFAPIDTGTRMAFAASGKSGGPLRFLQPLLRLALKRQFASHCANLKRVLESQP
jgi:uncharacterized protein YndB with AHSA1/START domain